LSLKDASGRVKERVGRLREEVRGMISGLSDGLPRPLMERPTIILNEPILARLHRMLRERKRR